MSDLAPHIFSRISSCVRSDPTYFLNLFSLAFCPKICFECRLASNPNPKTIFWFRFASGPISDVWFNRWMCSWFSLDEWCRNLWSFCKNEGYQNKKHNWPKDRIRYLPDLSRSVWRIFSQSKWTQMCRACFEKGSMIPLKSQHRKTTFSASIVWGTTYRWAAMNPPELHFGRGLIQIISVEMYSWLPTL